MPEEALEKENHYEQTSLESKIEETPLAAEQISETPPSSPSSGSPLNEQITETPPSSGSPLAKLIGIGVLVSVSLFYGYRWGKNSQEEARYNIKTKGKLVTITDSQENQEVSVPKNIISILQDPNKTFQYGAEKLGSDYDKNTVEIAYEVLEDVLRKDDIRSNMYKARIVMFAHQNGYIPKMIDSLPEEKRYELGKTLIEKLPDDKKAQLIKNFSVAALKYYGESFLSFVKQAYHDIKETDSYKKAEEAVKGKAKEVSQKSLDLLKDYLVNNKQGGE